MSFHTPYGGETATYKDSTPRVTPAPLAEYNVKHFEAEAIDPLDPANGITQVPLDGEAHITHTELGRAVSGRRRRVIRTSDKDMTPGVLVTRWSLTGDINDDYVTFQYSPDAGNRDKSKSKPKWGDKDVPKYITDVCREDEPVTHAIMTDPMYHRFTQFEDMNVDGLIGFIVEGTKGSTAVQELAVKNLDDDVMKRVVAAGIQGCYGGMDTTEKVKAELDKRRAAGEKNVRAPRVLHRGLARMLQFCETVYVVIDGDVAENPMVNAAARELLDMCAEQPYRGKKRPRARVRLIRLADFAETDEFGNKSTKDSISDILGREATNEARVALLKEMMAGATEKAPRPPKQDKQRTNGEIEVDFWDEGVTYKHTRSDTGEMVSHVIFKAAVRITEQVLDPGPLEVKKTLTVEVRSPLITNRRGEMVTATVKGVNPAKLHDLADLLTKVTIGKPIAVPELDMTCRAIANAIREFEPENVITVTRPTKTGYTVASELEEVRFATPCGSVGADGLDPASPAITFDADINESVDLDVQRTAPYTPNELVEAVLEEERTVGKVFRRDSVWRALGYGFRQGVMALSSAGAYLLTAQPGGGKTLSVRTLQSQYGPEYSYAGKRWVGGPVDSFTPGSARAVGESLHQCPVIIDDFRLKEKPSSDDPAFILAESATRRASGGGSARRRMDRGEGGRWMTGVLDDSDVTFILIAEDKNFLRLGQSGEQRVIHLEMLTEDMRRNAESEMERLAQSGALTVIFRGLMETVAGRINDRPEPLDRKVRAYQKDMNARVTALVVQLSDGPLKGIKSRGVKAAATMILSSRVYREIVAEWYANSTVQTKPRVLDEDYQNEYEQFVINLIRSQYGEGTVVNTSIYEEVLSEIAALQSKNSIVLFDKEDESGGIEYMGNIAGYFTSEVTDASDGEKQRVLHLIPSAVASALARETKFKNADAKFVRDMLAPFTVGTPDGKSGGTFVRRVRSKESAHRMVTIPMATWLDGTGAGPETPRVESPVEPSETVIEPHVIDVEPVTETKVIDLAEVPTTPVVREPKPEYKPYVPKADEWADLGLTLPVADPASHGYELDGHIWVHPDSRYPILHLDGSDSGF